MQEIRLSASAINDFRNCPMKYLYGYLYGLSPEKEKDSYRVGTIWHKCHEILEMLPQGRCPDCFRAEEIRPDCYLCNGTGVLPIELMNVVIRYLNRVYEIIPTNKTYDEWQVEQITILYSLSRYKWNYPDNKFKTVASEIWFNLPIINPLNNKRLGKASIVGRMDEIVQDTATGLYYIRERKSTSQSLEGTKYWGKLERAVQPTIYLYGARRWQMLGRLEKFGIMRDDPLIQGVWWDVWHKPSIAPKMLSQADSKAFVESGEYYGEKFDLRWGDSPTETDENGNAAFFIDNEVLNITPGKKPGTFTIFETPEMFGARLLSDIAERPDFYFQQREISRTDQQLEQFEFTLVNLVKLIRYVENNNLWDDHDQSCENPYHCDFKNICYGGAVVGPDDCPEGYVKREEKE